MSGKGTTGTDGTGSAGRPEGDEAQEGDIGADTLPRGISNMSGLDPGDRRVHKDLCVVTAVVDARAHTTLGFGSYQGPAERLKKETEGARGYKPENLRRRFNKILDETPTPKELQSAGVEPSPLLKRLSSKVEAAKAERAAHRAEQAVEKENSRSIARGAKAARKLAALTQQKSAKRPRGAGSGGLKTRDET